MTASATTPTAETRDRILRAAEELFAAKGYAATAVHEITSSAGVNRALLYYYFADKRALYEAILAQGYARFKEMLDRTLSTSGSYSDRLAAFLRGHLELVWDNENVLRVVHRCLLDRQQEEFKLSERFQTCIERLERFLKEGMDAGEFRPQNPASTAHALMGPTMAFSMWRLSGEPMAVSREELADQMIQLLLNGLSGQ